MVALLPRLRRYAYTLTSSREDADDLVQAACERALSRRHQWQTGTRLDSWMFRIIYTIRVDGIRSLQSRGVHVILEENCQADQWRMQRGFGSKTNASACIAGHEATIG